VEIVKRQVGHLTRLVDDLLDVSRITQGRIQLQRRSLELGSIVTQALESAEPLIREKRHQVILTSSSQPLYVDGDSARLVQCVTNLLTNAVKYTEEGGEIRVDARAEQLRAVISVSDNGIGISPDLMPRIFGLFVQSARSLDRSEGGLGIGLSLVQKLVEMHGGAVEAASEGPGRGSTFKISLPQIAAPQEISAAAAAVSWQRKRVLVVDDNVDAATSLVDLLRLDGHEVAGAYSAKEALESVNLFKPDAVLLDIGLPDMDGYQVAHRIRGIGPSVRIIALTGYGQAEDVQRARDAGFDAHMVKPVDLNALERAICGEGTHGPVRH
jgi:CheY-like chemotaxis protein